MTEHQVERLDKLVEIFKQYPKQELYTDDLPNKLRLGWKIMNPWLRVTIRLSTMSCWPKSILKLCGTQEGREAFNKLLQKSIWG
jgi:hypothetical protein